MPSRSSGLLLAGTVALFVGLTALPAGAAETANSEFVIIQADDVLENDLYAGAIEVQVQGTIDGDLVAFAAEEIVIEGHVTGSVIAVAPRVVVSGRIDGALRVSTSALWISGEIGRDVVAAAVTVHLGSRSSVQRDVQIWAWDMAALGRVGADLAGSMRTLTLAGRVGGNVDVAVGRLSVVDELEVGGDLGYRSSSEAEGIENAVVEGTVVQKTPLPPNIRVRALGLFGRLLAVIFLTLIAVGVAWGWPEHTRRAVDSVAASPLKAWGSGAVVMLSPVLLAGAAALILALAPSSASLPLLAIMAPVILAVLGLVFALALIAGVPTAGRLGRTLFRRLDLYGAMLCGSLLIGLAWLIPFVGWVIPLAVLPLGLGGWFLSWGRGAKQTVQASP